MIKMITLFLFVLSTGAFASDYSDGMDAMRERKYERAIERFTGSLDKDVIKGLVSAAKVKEQLNKAKTSYFNEMNTKISGYDKEKKYNDALDNVERGLRVLPENAKFASMKADYEKRIKDLDAKVKEGELLMNSKNWQEAYVYFQKLRPYEDTNRDINSNYRRAKEEIIDSYTAQAEGYEKNYDFISAKKEYEKALAYEPKDEGLNKKINVVKGRIVAQEMLGSAKTLSDQGQKEKSFEMLKRS
jgi:tetratricopeptide (TPR) repeat protein